MPIRSSDFQEAFGDFSDLLAQAEQRQLTIDEKAVPLLLGTVAYCAASPRFGVQRGQIREQALKSWGNMLQQRQGQVLVQEDIWRWIKEWFPDPIEMERNPMKLTDWMGDLKI